MQPTPNAGIDKIAAYVPGKSAVPAGVRLHKLSANETPLGPGQAARDAFAAKADHLEDYPDGSASGLRAAIAKAHGLNPDNIVCGNGSDELLHYLAQAYLAPGDEAIHTEHGFLVYPIEIMAAGATPVVAPETDHRTDVDAILERVSDKTRMIFLANPNNPTGTYIPMSQVRRLHAGLRGDILLVLDAAYAEYVRRNDYESGVELVASAGNVVMTRTFSKIHGLAALRVGWLYGPGHVVDALNRIRGPFNVSAPGLAAAEAAIADRAQQDAAVQHNETWRAWTAEALEGLGLTVTPSVGNFVLVHFDEAPITAEAADEALTAEGYVLRRVAGYGLPNALRMSIGTEAGCRGTLTVLAGLLGKPDPSARA